MKSKDLLIENAVEVGKGADSMSNPRDWTTSPLGTDTETFSTAPSGNEPIETMVDWPIGVEESIWDSESWWKLSILSVKIIETKNLKRQREEENAWYKIYTRKFWFL